MPKPTDDALMQSLDRLITEVGGDTEDISSKIVRELMHTAVKLLRDDANIGELKLISRSLKELRYALKVFRPYQDARKISVFGSARTPPDHPHYKAAETFSRIMAESGWMAITGAGDGIMRAGHGGAGTDKSFGVAIRLPFETNANDYIVGDPKLITFRYFFTRKLVFMWMSSAVALFPGGFGTQDEGFEALTLIQTGKAPIIPVVAVDAPGDDYWKKWKQYIEKELLPAGLISPEDMNLFLVTDDPAAAAREVLDFYRNYHSQRFVFDKLVLRMQRPLKDKQVDALNDEFASLVKKGRIEQGAPLKNERDEHPELPRLYFDSTKRDYGTIRMLINRINEYDVKNAR